jgi:hypothetical protein
MNERDNGSETVEGVGEEVPGLKDEQVDDKTNDGDDDAEERPVTVDLTRSEALTLLHVAWEKEIEMSSEASTAGLSKLMGNIGAQVGKEIYGPEMTEWLKDRQEDRDEMMEKMMEQMQGMSDNDPLDSSSGRVGFQ